MSDPVPSRIELISAFIRAISEPTSEGAPIASLLPEDLRQQTYDIIGQAITAEGQRIDDELKALDLSQRYRSGFRRVSIKDLIPDYPN